MIKVTLPDGAQKTYDAGTSALQVAMSISEGLARNVLAAKVNGQVQDATRPLPAECNLQLLTWNDAEGKATFWHSSAHLMAEALEALYPGVRFGIGPAIETGFYYDVDLGGRALSTEDFAAIEAKMQELAKRNVSFERKEVAKQEAISYFEQKGDPYKLELLQDLEDGSITFYTQGDFTDLCRGPHIPNTGRTKTETATKLKIHSFHLYNIYIRANKTTFAIAITLRKHLHI